MPTDAKATAAPTAPRARRDRSLAIAAGVLVVLGVVAGAALLSGARFTSATMGLLGATGALLLCLRALYRLAGALTRPAIETVLDQESLLGVSSQRELREEKRRLLRAINELTFDHEMGKLSAADYEAVKERYQLQAVEVMRALEGDGDLHPDLAAELRKLESGKSEGPEGEESRAKAAASGEAATEDAGAHAGEGSGAPEPASTPAAVVDRVCAACDTRNDVDARFCKQCGAAMEEAEA